VRLGIVLRDGDHAIEEARTAESLGFDRIASGEHVFFHGPTANAFVLLAAAAAVTTRVRLLTAVALLPLYPPALAAKMAATLDRVSAGRLDLGLGLGGEYPPEFAACGVPVTERAARLDEGLTVLDGLLSGQTVSLAGRFSAIDGLALDPPALQRPRPPIWLGGRKERAMRRAARHADVWMPYMYTPDMLATSLDQVRTAARDQGRTGRIRGAIFIWACVADDGGWARRVAAETVGAVYRQDFTPLADRYLLAGTPAEVTARLRTYADAGADEAVIALACPQDDRERVLRTLAEDVLPHLQ
jgi:probable F420-dependent oxidoreductase